jgi:hypothetical protein
MSAIDVLSRMSKPGKLVESTMTTSMSSMPGPTSVIQPTRTTTPEKKKPKLSDLLLKKKLRQEGNNTPVIPQDAKPDETETGNAPGDSTNTDEPAKGKQVEPFIPTSVALVAPDTTPDADKPLDPSQVPQMPQDTVTVSSPTPVDNGKDVLRTLIGEHHTTFKPTMMVDPATAKAAFEQALNGGSDESPNQSPTASATAAQVISEAQAGHAPKPHHNPNSMQKATSAMRAILGH